MVMPISALYALSLWLFGNLYNGRIYRIITKNFLEYGCPVGKDAGIKP